MKLSRSVRFRLGASLFISSALVACALDPLNPQPLPPSPEASFGGDAGVFSPKPDGGKRTEDSASLDAAAANAPDGGQPPPTAPDPSDAGDAGDPGDAGDAGDADATPTP